MEHWCLTLQREFPEPVGFLIVQDPWTSSLYPLLYVPLYYIYSSVMKVSFHIIYITLEQTCYGLTLLMMILPSLVSDGDSQPFTARLLIGRRTDNSSQDRQGPFLGRVTIHSDWKLELKKTSN